MELDVRMAVCDERLDVARVECVDEGSQGLDVSLRHPRSPLVAALRREAEVGERALAVKVDDHPRHLAAADVE